MHKHFVCDKLLQLHPVFSPANEMGALRFVRLIGQNNCAVKNEHPVLLLCLKNVETQRVFLLTFYKF